MSLTPVDKAYNKALDFLARREHSAFELKKKLIQREFSEDDIAKAIASLQANNLQDDNRFAESFIRARISKGQGRIRIRAELNRYNIADSTITMVFAELEPDWQKLAFTAWDKKFGTRPENMRDKTKQIRFLQYRGFTMDEIKSIVD